MLITHLQFSSRLDVPPIRSHISATSTSRGSFDAVTIKYYAGGLPGAHSLMTACANSSEDVKPPPSFPGLLGTSGPVEQGTLSPILANIPLEASGFHLSRWNHEVVIQAVHIKTSTAPSCASPVCKVQHLSCQHISV